MSRVFDKTTGEPTWITPKWVIDALGPFQLDPCAADNMPYRTAERMVTKAEDGLSFDWGNKRVWLNPPYGKDISKFLEKMHNGIALLPARVDTVWFHELVAPRCFSILFMKGRLRFLPKDFDKSPCMRPAFPSMLVAYSLFDSCCLNVSGIKGFIFYPERGGLR